MKAVELHPSCTLDDTPEWVLFDEFILTDRPYIRTVTEIKPEWYANTTLRTFCTLLTNLRLLEYAGEYFDLKSKHFPNGETKRGLQAVLAKKKGEMGTTVGNDRPRRKKRR